MSVPANEPAVITDPPANGPVDDTQVTPVAETEDAINPAWNNLLEKLPTSLHGLVIPELKAWDNNVQTLVGKVHSEYEPWKPFKEQSVEPESLNEAYAVYQAMQQDPSAFIEAVQKFYQLTPEQGQKPEPNSEEVQEVDPLDLNQNPEFLRVKGIAETMANAEIQRQQVAKQANEDAALEAELTRLEKEKGPFDLEFVLNKAATGKITLEQAVDRYNEILSTQVAAYQAKQNGAPVVMGAGGGTQSTALTPEQLQSPELRKGLIASMLAKAKQNAG